MKYKIDIKRSLLFYALYKYYSIAYPNKGIQEVIDRVNEDLELLLL